MKYMNWCKETKVVNLNPLDAVFRGGLYHLPTSSITDFGLVLPFKDGFKVAVDVIDDSGNPLSTKYILDLVGKTVYDKSNCSKSQVIDKLGEPDFEWTLDTPKTRFDEWVNNFGWVTNIQNKFQSEVLDVDSKRRYLYSTIVDPLRAESSDEALQGNIVIASELDKQRIEARKKIKDENPFPEYPTEL
ncbi:hypothetical protein PVK64_19225 [Aliivibrio sp. S4TY2]|uniref:hypothetical protein n=1 Tax=unclassified Aliivibrio TaxID=2645654 RepID=UPI00237852E9|nr:MULTISPECIES: hypothetical protein [unclassified Aliivibrio]MDD9158299.1 hypothetical protein [Aliivibrio sp. S4TY2]MDD9162269.1 hypothetical protein [Aliivibrio sp. S4TY1]MDD9166307.1 hypothetical protein [Aliivibrio sp. S4MY2]MDD9170305.1 hypothetical protein [Aliivibrio sp. S4MY4]MDD9187356.1 hypothetical protein [Aliivibrio sp. S4MY3]